MSRQVRPAVEGGRDDGRARADRRLGLFMAAGSALQSSSLPPLLHKHNEWMAPVVLAYTAPQILLTTTHASPEMGIIPFTGETAVQLDRRNDP